MQSSSSAVLSLHRDPVTERDQARERLKNELAALKQDSKEFITSKRLIDALEKLQQNPNDQQVLDDAMKLIVYRMVRFKATKRKKFDASQRRDLKIILFFNPINPSRLPRDVLQETCALLKLYGDQKDCSEVCAVFAGFRDIFKD